MDFKSFTISNHCSFVYLTVPMSGWMSYEGYFLEGHTRKEIPAVPPVRDCWAVCLREMNFTCLSVAYSDRGNLSCMLYDTNALSVYDNWTSTPRITSTVLMVRQICMMTSSNESIFHVTGHLCGEFTGHRWIPTKASDAEFWCFLWSAPV